MISTIERKKLEQLAADYVAEYAELFRDSIHYAFDAGADALAELRAPSKDAELWAWMDRARVFIEYAADHDANDQKALLDDYRKLIAARGQGEKTK